jgi:DNA-binding transcriptional MerR regulator
MQTCSDEVAAHLAGLSVPRVRRLVRAGLIQPLIVGRGRLMFGQVEVARLRKIRRLTTELGVLRANQPAPASSLTRV